VTFDERRGYIASAPELRHPIVALSLVSLRKRIEIALLPDDVRVVLHLDGLAERVGAPTKQNCAQGVRVLDPKSEERSDTRLIFRIVRGQLMLKSDKLEFERGAATKTENEDRYNGKENRHHDRYGTAGS
jgi:hypothetical protein